MHDSADKKQDPSIQNVWSMAANIADGMSLTIGGNFRDSDTPGMRNAIVDETRALFERQRARNEVPMLEAQLEEVQRRIKSAYFDLAQFNKAREGKPVKRDEAAHAERVVKSIEEMEQDYERGTIRLEETRKKAV